MQFFNNNKPDNNESSAQHSNGHFVSNRHMSWLFSAVVLLGLIVFITGYFLGQKKVLEQFSDKLEQDSMSDKIYSSLYTLYDSKNAPEADVLEAAAESEEGGALEVETVKLAATEQPVVAAPAESAKKNDGVAPVVQASCSAGSVKHFYAQLAGFGSSETAYAFANKLNKKGPVVQVKKHASATAKRGRVRHWYQVVTKPYEKKDVLIAFVEKVKQEERLKDVRILPC